MKQVLLPLFYLPPVSWFSIFNNENIEITIEQCENFPKQTYRNRAHIYGANGRLALVIPIHHNGKRVMKDIEISYAESWQQLHWKSIKIAYQSSPYFEYYESQLSQIYTNQPKFLLDFNLKALSILQDLMKSEKKFKYSSEYQKHPETIDLRGKFSAKKESEFPLDEYYQTFSDKAGYLKDLSIIDLLCNNGPESVAYLRRTSLIF